MAFREAGKAKIGGKFLGYGDTGSGKTFFLLTFPKVAIADSEVGTGHYEKRDIEIAGNKYNNIVFVDDTSDIDTLEEDIDSLLDGEFDGKVESFGVDSETKFYNAMQVACQETEERRARKKGNDVDDANLSVRSWGRIKLLNMKLQQAKIDLSARGIHVVSIAQQADLRDKKDADKIIGEKPDMHKSVPYDYDVVLHFYKKKNKDGEEEFFAEVVKDRTMVTKPGEVIQNCTYDVWKEYFDGNAKLETRNISYKNDLSKSIEDQVDQSEKVDDLVTGWKTTMKELNLSKNTDALKKINKKMQDMKVDVKSMALQPLKVVEEIVDYTNALV